jgi:hypothetical protein
VLLGRPEGKRSLGRLRHVWEYNIKMDLKEIDKEGLGWINLAWNWEKYRALTFAVMNFRVL